MTLFQTLLAATLSLSATAVVAKDYAIVLSPNVDKAQAATQFKQSISFLTSLKPGDVAMVINGDTVATLGHFTVPQDAGYGSPKALLRYNGAVIGQMARFAKAAEVSPARVKGSVNLPAAVRHIATNKRGYKIDVVVLGSVLYDAPAQPQFSMKGGIIPGDGHLKHGLGDTPYGVSAPELLKGLRVHMGYDDILPTSQHKHYIERFWSLYMQAQGAQLVSFTSDIPTLFERARFNSTTPQNSYKVEATDKLEMIRLAPPAVEQKSIYHRAISGAALSAQQVRKASNVQIGIAWQCLGCDLDLYARAQPGAQVLWFGHTKSDLGVFFKDYQVSPTTEQGYETIAFSTPIDLRALQIFVNFYKGDAPQGVNGEVRISVDGRTYAKPFHISAQGGAGLKAVLPAIQSGSIGTPALIAINPLDVVKR